MEHYELTIFFKNGKQVSWGYGKVRYEFTDTQIIITREHFYEDKSGKKEVATLNLADIAGYEVTDKIKHVGSN